MAPALGWFRRRRWLLVATLLAFLFPFVIAVLVDGVAPGAVFSNEAGNAKFLEGLAIEIFILALYAISYDLILGISGLLSFGHAMFFAVGAYTIGIMLRSFEMGFFPALGIVIIAALVQAALFAIVLPRVKGITFALVTLGMASAFSIIIQSSELKEYAGAEIGLQGVISPAWLDTTADRFRFYLVSLAILVIVYVLYTRLVNSPTGRVLVATRENEDRALMLGYNTFWFKFTALVVSSMTAALAGVLHTLHQPIVTPNVAGLGWTVTALLIILIGGVGTISGAVVGAAVYRLLQFFLDRWFGGASSILIGIAYIALVLYLPFGIVGTWRLHSLQIAAGRRKLFRMLTGRPPDTESVEEP